MGKALEVIGGMTVCIAGCALGENLIPYFICMGGMAIGLIGLLLERMKDNEEITIDGYRHRDRHIWTVNNRRERGHSTRIVG